jgi:MFS family permease
MTKATSAPASRPGLRDLLRNSNFRWLWLGQIISNYGDSLTSLALLILINRLTGSTAAIATVAILMALPQVTIGMVAGVFVDRWSRKTTMIVSDILRGGLVLGFLLVRNPDDVWILYALTLLQATVGVFFSPARMALLANVVAPAELLGANSIAQTSRIIFALLGTASAGVIIGLWEDFAVIFIVDAITFLLSAFFTWRVLAPHQQSARVQASARVILAELMAGMRVIFSSRVLTGVLVSAAIVMLGVGAVNVLFVPLLINELGLPETWFGAIEAAQVAGMVAGGALLTALSMKLQPTRIISLGLIVLGAGIAAVAAVTRVWQIMFLLFPVGLAMTPVNAAIATLTQVLVSDELRGRIGAALQAMIGAANITSMALAGVLAGLIGVRNVFLLAGGLAVFAGVMAIPLFGKQPSATAAEVADG